VIPFGIHDRQRKVVHFMKHSSNAFFYRFLLSVLVLGLPALFSGTALVRAQAAVSGRVFQDYNNSGSFDAGRTLANNGAGTYTVAEDIPIGGVTVTIFGPAGTPIGSGLTGPDGQYSILPNAPGPYRVEFSAFPPGFQPGAFGAQNASTVQFVDAAGGTGVDLGINLPGEYCQDNPDLITPCYVFGDQNGAFPDIVPGNPPINNSGLPALVSFPYSAGSNGASIAAGYDTPLGHTVNLSAGQIGTTWGVAWARVTSRIYSSSFFKRHSGFGAGADATPLTADDPGAIYLINPATNAVTNVFTVPNATVNAHGGPNWFRDNNNIAWDAVGKTSLGGIALSDDETRLFAMNLQDRVLYALDAVTGAVVGTSVSFASVPVPGCAAGDIRPFAVQYYRGLLYVGVVCSAESTQIVANLNGFVYSVSPTTLAINGVVFQFSFNYPRGIANANGTVPSVWQPWSPGYATLPVPAGENGSFYPQPMLTDIAFDRGNLVLGIRDRNGDQVGSFTPSNPVGADTDLLAGVGVGDTLRACGSPAGGWTLETNGRCGGTGTAAQGTGLGPGGAEFYFDDGYGIPGQFVNHDDMGLGGIGQIPGFPDLVVASTNPYPFSSAPGGGNFQVFDGGIRWMNNTSGAFTKAYRLFDDGPFPNTLGKANGLGDIAALCFPMPVEIGNRVWLDTNRNGVQDAGETPIANVRVDLFSPAGALLSSVFTNDRGEYYFSNGAGTDARFADYGVAGLTFNTSGFQVRIDGNQLPLTGLELTFTENSLGTPFGSTLNDNNGVPTGTIAIATFNVGAPGANNHTIDFGYFSPTAPIPTLVVPPTLPGGTPGIIGTPGVNVTPGLEVAGLGISSPGVSKSVDRPFVAPGDTVIFTISVTNPNATAVSNVEVSDSVPGAFEVLSASASRGVATVNGQQVSLSISTLAPGEIVTVTITTRVRGSAGGGLVANFALVSGGFSGQASANVVIINALPALGEEPWWRAVLLLTIGAAGVWAIGLTRRRLTRC
jgi:uncharacterized repeat protein (TIGR01451 family)